MQLRLEARRASIYISALERQHWGERHANLEYLANCFLKTKQNVYTQNLKSSVTYNLWEPRVC